MRTPRLPAVDWTDAPADLNGLVRFAERRNLVSARVPSHFKRSLPCIVKWLCNVTNKIQNLIQFLLSSTCFEHHLFIIRNTICTGIFYCMFFMHVCKQSSRWKDVLDTAFHLLDCLDKYTKSYHTKLHIQMVFLMMNAWCSEHVEDIKKWIKH